MQGISGQKGGPLTRVRLNYRSKKTLDVNNRITDWEFVEELATFTKLITGGSVLPL